ncbi:sigma-70 family RNA polymerase sigma factor [Metapseudomonas otitidis]|jgi:RNA polymerase sigma-70 factor (ECF subfamily)|uniref:RNA polymerase sigma factor n=2 Tax=Metapseudomonas otitidis TaxID=319939 RepID=A0A679G8Q0_9GAMM|nr:MULTISPECIES: sigma-70 family RNA polymerase sigma factor [Pseudomonas]MDL5601959.1 sigma-70 family RNA polymerase sigma factor [Bacillus subtilis]MBO2930132.1 sigma-70 family RNA polymerase sigma factor [Pseudomonas otitidis]MCO7556605.1 sigma-70 family RNA polymerase sigma factor [Pseudomonas otitidis]MCP1618611.1 RNA polymerase sigma-70 factor (ECF subfamily) [Pseudomonas otitidis]MDG9784878.1 sigma-70 family RNA polymerase sigma factor [Pseudomonas otitidis]
MSRTDPQATLDQREAELQGLLLRGMAGDAAAYRGFLTALGGYLRGFLRHRLASRPTDVEDLLQEVLLAVHNARHTYRADQPLTAWVYAIARYKLADHFRGFARREALQDPLEDSEQTLLAVEDGEPAEARRDLGRLLGQLPDRQRLPIVHVKLDGLSVEETARLTGQSSSAVKVNIHRGLKALAALIRGTQNDEDR